MPRKTNNKANPKTTGEEDDNSTNGHVEESVVEEEKEDTVVQDKETEKQDTIEKNGSFVREESPMVQKSPHRSFTPSPAYLASQVIYFYFYTCIIYLSNINLTNSFILHRARVLRLQKVLKGAHPLYRVSPSRQQKYLKQQTVRLGILPTIVLLILLHVI